MLRGIARCIRYSPDLSDPIRKAAGIIGANMQTRRIPDDGFLLLAESPYHEKWPPAD